VVWKDVPGGKLMHVRITMSQPYFIDPLYNDPVSVTEGLIDVV
jgi:hypothetical protein